MKKIYCELISGEYIIWKSKFLRKMRIVALLLIISITQTFALEGYSQTKQLSLNCRNETILNILDKIENQSEFYFMFNANIVDINQRKSINCENQPLITILDQLMEDTEIIYEISDRQIVLTSVRKTEAEQQKSVSGKVTDSSNSSLPGVTVIIKGTTQGTVTDIEGNYSLVNVSDDATLVFSFVGMEKQEIPVEGKSTINVVLAEESIGLAEVIAIGYGTMKKSDLTGSVAALNRNDYEAQPVNRVDQILQGRISGVNVVNSSGAPGGATSIRIRGANSINGNNDPLYVIDGFVGADYRNVNPTDIETIQVLKDASSTAIYGSRGSNGVVLITTKGGVSGNPKFSLSASYFTSKVLKTWDIMDAFQFATVSNERALAMGTTPTFSDADIALFKNGNSTDWQNEVLRIGKGQEYQLDYSGGNERITYFISGSFYDQEGIIINSNYKRYSLRTNLNAIISNKLSANLKMSFARRENNNTEGNSDNRSVLAAAIAWSPTTPIRDEYGKLTLNDLGSTVIGNPLEIAQNDYIRENNVFNANGSFIIKPFEGLTLDIGFGVSYGNTQQKDFSANSLFFNPTAVRGSLERVFLQNTNTLTYTKTINDVHRITATGVMEHQFLQNDIFFTTAGELQFPNLKYDNITLANSLSSEAVKSKETIRSFIGRINYSLMDKYLLTASVRTDGSSKFRGSNQYSTFPSIGLGWRLSEEPFIKDLGFLDNLKFRASVGKTGSQAIPVFGTVTNFNTSALGAGSSFENGKMSSGIIIGNPGNENLKWETTKQINAGLDISVFNNKLNAEIDYFVKNTTDLLLSVPLPQYSGGGSIFRNLGEVKNTGFEFTLGAKILDKKSGLNWTSSINASFLKNEVISIGDQRQIFVDGDIGQGNTNLPEGVILPGYSLSNYWCLKYLGVWQLDEASEAIKYGNVPGDSKYEDVNNDFLIGGDDYQRIGSGIPTHMFGWNNTIKYKAFTLNVFFQALMGFDKWNFTYAQSIMASTDAREITHSDILDRWSPDNQNSNIPAFSATDVPEFQTSRFLEKGDYLRLKNLSLSYNLPKDFVLGINGSVIISGTNLWTLTNYKGLDPESYSNLGSRDSRGADAGSYPNAKTWTFGVRLNF